MVPISISNFTPKHICRTYDENTVNTGKNNKLVDFWRGGTIHIYIYILRIYICINMCKYISKYIYI